MGKEPARQPARNGYVMKRLQIYSTALSVGCAVGVLMAVILTSNENTLPRTAVVIPTKSPLTKRQERINRLAFQPNIVNGNQAPNSIDRMITSSIPRRGNKPARRNIAELISASDDSANPYPGGDQTVRVKPGDTLFAIAKRTGINAHKLAAINTIKSPYLIRPGQILYLYGVNQGKFAK